MTLNRNIAVFTSIRSEYGLLKPVLRALKTDEDFTLKLLVGGAHLDDRFGKTITQIIDDGFEIEKQFPFLAADDNELSTVKSLSVLQNQVAEYFHSNKPDMLMILGDRFELLPVVTCALLMNIPVAHISGGDVTEGAIDNQVRHAITKMAHLHFPATEIYRQHILQLGEEDWRIHVSGDPFLDEIMATDFISKEKLFAELNLKTDTPVISCTFHPETIDNKITTDFLKNLFSEIISKTNYQLMVTAANFDSGGSAINQLMEELSAGEKRIVFRKSLGQKKYYSLLKHADIILGNSSSGVVEAQSFNLPAVNVGKRQQGRLTNKNVLHCEANSQTILSAIQTATSTEFRNSFFNSPNIYGKGNAASEIISFLKKTDWKNSLLKKSVFNA